MKAWLYIDKADPSQRIELDVPVDVTIHEWVLAEAPDYQKLARQPASIWIGGEMIPVARWSSTMISAGDVVEVHVEPAGGDGFANVINTIFPGMGHVFNYVMQALIPELPKTDDRRGSSIYDANAQGNRPRLGGVVPELAGRHGYYPDHLTQRRRYYVANEQYIDLFFSVCAGHCYLPLSDIRIANGSVERYAGDVALAVFGPGESVASHPAHRNWYTSPEVDRFVIEGAEVSSISADGEFDLVVGEDETGSYVLIRDAAGAVDPGWAVGSRIEITGTSATSQIFEGVLDVIDGGDDGLGNDLPDVLRGAYAWSGITVGQVIQISSGTPLDGVYAVGSVSGRDLHLQHVGGGDVTDLTPATGVLVRLQRTDTADGLYDVTARDLDMTYVTKHAVPGWPGFGPERAYDDASVAVVVGARPRNQYGPYPACPPGKKTGLIEITFERRQGWGRYNSEGKLRSLTVELEIRYRDINAGGDWTVVPKVFTGRSIDELGETMAIELPESMEPEVMIVRLTGKFGSTRYVDRIEWTALAALLPTATVYEYQTTLAMTIKGSNALSGVAESRLLTIPTAKRQVLLSEGVWSTELVATRDISAFYRHVLLSAGYTDDQLPQAALWHYHQIWTARGDTYDAIIDNPTTVLEAANEALRPGYAKTFQVGDRWYITRDEPVTFSDVEQQFGPGVQLVDSFEMTDGLEDEDDRDGVDVEYMDPVTWKPATVQCRLDGQAGLKPLTVTARGVTDRLRAWRLGMREAAKAKHGKRSMRWRTAAAGFNARPGAVVSCADIEPGFSQSGRLQGWDAATLTLTLSSPLLVDDGAAYVIALRRPDGSQWGPAAATPTGVFGWYREYEDDQAPPPLKRGYHQVRLSVAPDFPVILEGTTAGDPTYYLAGTADTCFYLGIVQSVKPQGTQRVQIEAKAYAPEVYAWDDAELPEGL